MTAVTDAITEGLATLSQIMDAPAAPVGYGSDLACQTDLTDQMTELDGVDDAEQILAEAILRRLDCPRGGLPDDPNYGYDVRGDLNRGMTTDEIRALAGRIRNEVEKDDRVDSVVVTVTPSSTGDSLAISIRVTPVDASLGVFKLLVAVTDGSLLLQEIQAA